MTPFKMTHGVNAIVPMEFLVISLGLTVQERLPMEKSQEHRIQELLKLEKARQESVLLTEVVQRRQKAWADTHGRQKMLKKGNKVLVFNSKTSKHPRKLKLR